MSGNKTPGLKTVADKPPPVKRKDNWKKAKKLKKLRKLMKSRDFVDHFGKHPGSSSSTNLETDPGSSSKNPLSAAVRLLLQVPKAELKPSPAVTPGPQ